MIDKAAEKITEVLNHPDIINAIAEDKISWDLAPEKTAYPFVSFDIYDEGLVTKNPVAKVFAKVRVYSNSLTQAAQVSTIIRNTVKENHPRIYDRGAKSGYTDPESKEAAVEITFEFKI